MRLSSLVGHIVELSELVDLRSRREENNQPADHTVSEFFRSRKYLGSHDRRFITEAVYGIVRHRRRLARMVHQFIAEHLSPSIESLEEKPFLPQYLAYTVALEEVDPQQVITVLRDTWRTTFPGIDLAQFVYWLVQHKLLDFLTGDDVQQLADWYSFQEWMVREWMEQVGQDEAEDLLHALNGEAPVTLRVNTIKTTVAECQARLKREGIETTRTRYSPVGLVASHRFNAQASPAFKEGLFEVQDEGSQIICYIAEPRQETFVIDACAGTGGKSLLTAELMKNKGEILALDIHLKRLKELEKRAKRNGIEIIVAKKSFPEGGPVGIHPGNLLGKADMVLVDAPCSGVGTVRRNPGLKWTVTESMLDQYANMQFRIIDTYAAYVKRGGRLVYGTCSLFRKENEEVVEKFLSLHNEFQSSSPTPMLTKLGIDVHEAAPYIKLLPHRHGTDGFFVAVLLKRN